MTLQHPINYYATEIECANPNLRKGRASKAKQMPDGSYKLRLKNSTITSFRAFEFLNNDVSNA